jgi:hypothetical protein
MGMKGSTPAASTTLINPNLSNSFADTNPTTVGTINPSNAQTGVPLNAQITAVMSDDIDPTTVTNSSITVTPSDGSAIAGTVTLASDGVALTFVPSEPAIFIMGSTVLRG